MGGQRAEANERRRIGAPLLGGGQQGGVLEAEQVDDVSQSFIPSCWRSAKGAKERQSATKRVGELA
jgi:hypothetical protein